MAKVRIFTQSRLTLNFIVWHESQEMYQNFDKLTGRFVSEFGMQAFPSIKTVDSFLESGSLERFSQSSTMDFHNKAAGQERRLATSVFSYISEYMDTKHF